MQDPIYDQLGQFLRRYYWAELIELSGAYPEQRSLNVSFKRLDNFNSRLADMLLNAPDSLLNEITQALKVLDLPNGVILDEASVRIINNPNKIKIRGIRHEHISKLVGIEGIVTKATEVYPKILTATFECPFCGHIFTIEQTGEYKEPVECPSDEGGCGRKARKFKFLVDRSTFTNSQKVRLQEPLEDLQGGDVPHTIDIELESDITGIVTPGMRVIINGVLRSQQQKTTTTKKLTFSVYMEANSIEKQSDVFEEIKITDEDEQKILELSKRPEIYKEQIKSIAPFIYGNEEIKEALLLQLFGGTRETLPDGDVTRGDIHILLIGDPGLGKSKLGLSQVNLAPRALYVSGKTTSAAGLTAAAVKDEFGDGKWSLEAGALVLADRALAIVDEMDKMNKSDRNALHEAMEQQTVSIAKAGIMARLNSRCALLGIANPKSGHFDKYTAIAEQINIPVTLLSRFDLIYTMMDRPQEEADMATVKHIFKTRKKRENLNKSAIPLDLLRKYIAYSRARPAPKMSNEAEQKLEEFYIGIRKQAYDTEAPIPITVRQLESLIRLSEARARARLSDTVTVEDADRVINLMTYCLKSVYIDPESGQMDVDWIVAGTTKTKRDRARTIKEIIIDLEKEHGDKVPITEIYEVATEEGIEQDKAEEIIEVMKRDGILFSRGMGVVGLVR